jgi:DNA-binding MarR family transcriptional regulator
MSHAFSLACRDRFGKALERLHQCCTDQHAYVSEKFPLPQAELRCLMLFGEERYLTSKGICSQLNTTKSRVSKIVDELERKKLVVKVDDPADSRVTLLALTPAGQNRRREVLSALDGILNTVLGHIDPARREADTGGT